MLSSTTSVTSVPRLKPGSAARSSACATEAIASVLSKAVVLPAKCSVWSSNCAIVPAKLPDVTVIASKPWPKITPATADSALPVSATARVAVARLVPDSTSV